MNTWGKVIGAGLGLVSGGPIGGVVGLVLGHSLDSMLPQWRRNANLARAQAVFFRATFRILGSLAKADGRVSEREVAMVEQLMQRLRLDATSRRRAIRCFNDGKAHGFRVADEVNELARETKAHIELRRLALEMALEIAFADGRLKPEGRSFLERMAASFGIPERELSAMLELRGAGPEAEFTPYEILEVETDASMAEIKRAYRRLMAKHHPDKLVSRGLPPEMLALAEERTREIRAAYDQLRQERGA